MSTTKSIPRSIHSKIRTILLRFGDRRQSLEETKTANFPGLVTIGFAASEHFEISFDLAGNRRTRWELCQRVSVNVYREREREREMLQFRLEIWYSRGSANRRALPPLPPCGSFAMSRLAKNTRISDRWSLRPIFRGLPRFSLRLYERRKGGKKRRKGEETRVSRRFLLRRNAYEPLEFDLVSSRERTL